MHIAYLLSNVYQKKPFYNKKKSSRLYMHGYCSKLHVSGAVSNTQVHIYDTPTHVAKGKSRNSLKRVSTYDTYHRDVLP